MPTLKANPCRFARFLPPADRRSDVQTALSLPLQQLAVRLLGNDRGAVVMLDPRSGEQRLFSGTPPEAIEPFTSFAADGGVAYISGGTNGLTVDGVDER